MHGLPNAKSSCRLSCKEACVLCSFRAELACLLLARHDDLGFRLWTRYTTTTRLTMLSASFWFFKSSAHLEPYAYRGFEGNKAMCFIGIIEGLYSPTPYESPESIILASSRFT